MTVKAWWQLRTYEQHHLWQLLLMMILGHDGGRH